MTPRSLAFAAILALAAPAHAAGPPVGGKGATAVPRPEIIVEDTAPVAGGIILPALALVILAAVLASGD
ncbi:hypothetical protein [Jannaschia sp. W003]|uniref:hypothetical protein n=1 Tax=Jannaschia sp. W003 TaxID=2867012 RepID=UPI0021A84662|nr:hypothetical protein [Jannaschia sp. W003]UWQ22052.1 hypothetical protein K3554_03205 [Jannaschia sp. W003]